MSTPGAGQLRAPSARAFRQPGEELAYKLAEVVVVVVLAGDKGGGGRPRRLGWAGELVGTGTTARAARLALPPPRLHQLGGWKVHPLSRAAGESGLAPELERAAGSWSGLASGTLASSTSPGPGRCQTPSGLRGLDFRPRGPALVALAEQLRPPVTPGAFPAPAQSLARGPTTLGNRPLSVLERLIAPSIGPFWNTHSTVSRYPSSDDSPSPVATMCTALAKAFGKLVQVMTLVTP